MAAGESGLSVQQAIGLDRTGGVCCRRGRLRSPGLCGRSARRARGGALPGASSGRCSSSPASSCGSKERAASLAAPPGRAGSTRLSSHPADGSWRRDTRHHEVLKQSPSGHSERESSREGKAIARIR